MEALQHAGNVSEWIKDWHGTYPDWFVSDHRGPRSGSKRVIRGGGHSNCGNFNRAPDRDRDEPEHRDEYVGFRFLKNSNSDGIVPLLVTLPELRDGGVKLAGWSNAHAGPM